MSRAEKVEREMEKRGWGPRDLSRETGVAYTTIRSLLERNFANASIDSTSKICKALNITIDDLVSENYSTINFVAESTYPYITTPISAGSPETVDGVEKLENISIPDSIMGRYAGQSSIHLMRVNGESMNRVIPNGSLIAVKKMPREQIKNGDIVVYNDSYEYAVKRVYRVDDKIIFRPDSTDLSFTDYVTDADENLDIIGKVVVYIVELD
ncbi:XRE family transcriptional regulator [Mycobacterium tuberculosis]|uniref:LexA family protein n=1 Tax=Mycobacterium tuberculosis TaxID=1773 RepID=UPI002875A291|nr:XRE family transcriptional regulator [Mycobacterium tuberculosis]MDS0320889.1 XRE family transcriptional regulator [Mycobacterium tuberculosis]